MATVPAETQIQKTTPIPSTRTLRILIADDHDILRRG